MSFAFFAAALATTSGPLVCNAVDTKGRISSFSVEIKVASTVPEIYLSGFGALKRSIVAKLTSRSPQFFVFDVAGQRRFLSLNDAWLSGQFAVLDVQTDVAGERGPVESTAICGAHETVVPAPTVEAARPVNNEDCYAVDVLGRTSSFVLGSDGPGKPQVFKPKDNKIWSGGPIQTEYSFMPGINLTGVAEYLKSSKPAAGTSGPSIISFLIIEKGSRKASQTMLIFERSGTAVRAAAVAHCSQLIIPVSTGL